MGALWLKKRTSQETVDYIVEQILGAGDVRSRKMFGEYAIYCDEKVVALACRDELFVKVTDAGAALAPDFELAPAHPGAKPGIHVPREKWDDSSWMTELIRVTADALPLPKKT